MALKRSGKPVIDSFSNIMLIHIRAYGEERMAVRGGEEGAIACLQIVCIQYILVSLVSPCSLQLLFSVNCLKLKISRNNYPGISSENKGILFV